MTPIRSERLTLRLMTHTDVDTYVAYRSDPVTLELLETHVPPIAERIHAEVDAAASLGGLAEDHWVRLAVTLAGEEEMIGDVGAGIKNGAASSISATCSARSFEAAATRRRRCGRWSIM